MLIVSNFGNLPKESRFEIMLGLDISLSGGHVVAVECIEEESKDFIVESAGTRKISSAKLSQGNWAYPPIEAELLQH
jgi:hypothetical protein